MGCVASKLVEEEEVVSICKERKHHLKLAVKKRYALAEAHCKYFQALFAVSAAIKLFVAPHSSPSPFLITFPSPSEKVISNSMFLQQKPYDSSHEHLDACPSCASFSLTESSMEEIEEDEQQHQQQVEEERIEQMPAYFYMQMPSPHREFGVGFIHYYCEAQLKAH